MNKPCPTCPQEKLPDGTLASVCSVITVDAKRVGIPVRHHTGVSPADQTNANSPQVDVRSRCTAQRFFWPEGVLKNPRLLARSLAGDVLGKTPRKGDVHFQASESTSLLQNAPIPYRGALRMLVDAFKSSSVFGTCDHENGGSDGEGDNDFPEHGTSLLVVILIVPY
jgi:hypothetical protein